MKFLISMLLILSSFFPANACPLHTQAEEPQTEQHKR